MSISAYVLMAITVIVLYGGILVCIWIAMRSSRRQRAAPSLRKEDEGFRQSHDRVAL